MGSGLLESIIRDLPGVAVLALDRDLRLTFAGGAGLGAHGWDAERLTGRDVRDLLPARAARLIAPHHAAALAGAVSVFEFPSADGARTSALEIAPLVERGETVGSIAVVRDITETVRCRERAALAADDSRREFTEAAQGMVIGSLTGKIVDVNTSFTRTLGYEHHELLGRSWSEITHPEDRERDHRRVMALAAQAPPGDPEADTYRTEKRYLRRDGGVMWADTAVRLLRDTDGRPLRFVVHAVEITTRKRAEAAQQASELRFRTLARLAPVGIVIADTEGKLTYVTPRFCELAGMTPAQALGDGWLAAIHPDDRERVADARRHALAHAGELSIECRFCLPSGQVRWIHIISMPLADDDGNVSGRIGAVVDLTERVDANRRFEQMLESAPDAIIGVDRSGRIVIANRRAEELFGYSPAELLELQIEELVPEALRDSHRGHREGFHGDRRIRRRPHPLLELRALRKDGSEFPCEISLSTIETGQGAVVVAGITDMTERHRIEAALRQSEEQRSQTLEKMLRVQEDERSRIAADLHDDTIQVMTAALISLGVVNRHVQGVGDERKQRAIDGARDTLAEAIERTRRMTFDLRPQLLDADGVGAAITSLAKAVATEAGFAISIDVSAERYAPVIESLVYRTVREVLTNTRKHAHAAHVHVGLREHDGALHGTITDDGRGFDVETALERARQTFHVGFDIIAERVRLAGGAFEIFSAPGRGTDVRFSVPVVREARPPA